MKNSKLYIYSAMTILGCLATKPALAQEFPVITSVEANYAGLGLGVTPDYMGSDDYTFGVLPAFRYEFGDNRNFELIGNYASANLINHDIISFGPAFRYRFGRDDDIEDEVVDDLPEIDDAAEVGARLDARWILDGNPRNRFAVGIDALGDVSNASDGFNSTLSARYWRQVSEMVDLGISGNMLYGDDNFQETYFGIDAAGSAASGLPVHEAEGGITSFSIQPMVAVHLNENWHIGGGIRYTRLNGDAADSPIVDDRGDENQLIGGIGVIYSWGAKVHRR